MIKTISSLLIFYSLLFNIHSFGQGGKGEYVWPEYLPTTITEDFKEKEAFYIENAHTIDFMKERETQEVIFKRIMINSEAAAEEFSQLDFYIGNSGFLSVLKGRNIKKNGEIIELTEDQIIETYARSENKYGSQLIRRVQFLFPDVSVGDVLDISYQIDYPFFSFSDLLYLEDDLPSMHSTIALRNFSDLELTLFHLNEMPLMQRSAPQGIATLTWEKENVAALTKSFFGALPPDHPSFVYMLWLPNKKIDYSLIYEHDENDFPTRYKTSFSVTDFLIEKGVISKDGSPVGQLNKVVQYFEKEMDWNRDESTQYSRQTFEFFEKNKVDQTLFLRYIMRYLNENNVSYEKGFTKSLVDGKFETGFASLEQIAIRFLFIYDENENPHFLFPPTQKGQYYYLDETPFYAEENQSIVLKGKKGFLDTESGVLLPGSSPSKNRHNAFISLTLNPANSSFASGQRRDALNGHYSYLTRNDSKEAWLDELGIPFETSTALSPSSVGEAYPYRIEFTQANDSVQCIEAINDSLYWFVPTDMLPKGVYLDGEMNYDLANYMVMPFVKQHTISFFIKSEGAITSAEETSEILVENEVGVVKAVMSQMDPKTLKLDYYIVINKRFLSTEEDMKAFKALMTNYADVSKKKWIIQLG